MVQNCIYCIFIIRIVQSHQNSSNFHWRCSPLTQTFSQELASCFFFLILPHSVILSFKLVIPAAAFASLISLREGTFHVQILKDILNSVSEDKSQDWQNFMENREKRSRNGNTALLFPALHLKRQLILGSVWALPSHDILGNSDIASMSQTN